MQHDHSALPGFVLVQDVRTVRRAFFGTGNTTATANATADAGAPSLADASAPIMLSLIHISEPRDQRGSRMPSSA